MRLGLAAALLTLSLLPATASAQAPDPEDAVQLACMTVGGVEPQARDLLPICPREEPAGPAPADEGAATAPAPAPAPAPGSPESAQALAAEVVDTAGEVAEDPPGAPERLAALAATILQFVKDLLELPAAGAGVVADTITSTVDRGVSALQASATATLDAGKGASSAVTGAFRAAIDAIGALFDAPAVPVTADARTPKAPTRGEVDLQLPLGKLRQVLPEGQ